MVLIIIVSIMMMFTDCSDGGSGVDSNLVEGNKTSTINVSQKDGTTIQVTMYYPDGTPYESWVYKQGGSK